MLTAVASPAPGPRPRWVTPALQLRLTAAPCRITLRPIPIALPFSLN